jgi:hypothetical protein
MHQALLASALSRHDQSVAIIVPSPHPNPSFTDNALGLEVCGRMNFVV